MPLLNPIELEESDDDENNNESGGDEAQEQSERLQIINTCPSN